MPPRRIIGLVLAITWLVLLPALAAANPKERIEYWQKHYDELLAKDDRRAARAHDIFQRILNAAGKRPGVVPRLYITKTDPWNISLPIAIPDGWVILSKGALEICYRDPQRGDDRLAFVLAHEIAHQLKDDFWHLRFFQAIEASKTRAKDEQFTKVLEEARNIARATDHVLFKELQADEHGILYASMAGFNTTAIVSEDGKVNFFEAWLRALDPSRIQGVRTDPSHPSPQQRAATVTARLQQVLAHVDLFTWGLRFYQVGEYERAVLAFEKFLTVFPSREVYHNLATSHHQLAVQYYRVWKKDALALPWKLSLAIDPVTRASGMVVRGAGPPADLFNAHLDQAIDFYQTAITLDPSYTPARNNLGCALILKGDLYKAIAMFQDGLRIAPDAAELLNNLGVAFVHAENPNQARTHLLKAHELDPAYDAPLWNLGKLGHTERHEAEAQKYWLAYLQLDPVSPWADALRQALSLGKPASATPAFTAPVGEHLLGVPVGAFKDELPAEWGKPVQSREIALKGACSKAREQACFEAAVYKNGAATLSQNDAIQILVAQEEFRGSSARGISIGSLATDVRANYGVPSRILHMPHGATWVYDVHSIAFQLRAGKVVSWLVF
jgi:tetratricopeptide (TPR) repeat protein